MTDPVQEKNNTKAISVILVISAVAFLFLVWLIYFNTKSESADPNALTFLPGLNALLNGLSATCIIVGVAAIKKGMRKFHIASMVSAITLSAVFLVSYIIYHNIHGDTKFATEGAIRYVYFGILISHIILTVFALPLIFSAVYFALTKQFSLHKKVVKYTVPIWLYVSITGVVIYFLLKYNS